MIFTQHHKTVVSGTGQVRSGGSTFGHAPTRALCAARTITTWLQQGSHLQFQPGDLRKGSSTGARGQHWRGPMWGPPCVLVRESGKSMCDFKSLLDSRFLAPVPSWHGDNHGQHARQAHGALRLRVREQTPQVLSDKQGHWEHGRLRRACGCPQTFLGTDASGLHLPACTQVCGPCCPEQWCSRCISSEEGAPGLSRNGNSPLSWVFQTGGK